jgi:multidrug efflux system membrane fusion protein
MLSICATPTSPALPSSWPASPTLHRPWSHWVVGASLVGAAWFQSAPGHAAPLATLAVKAQGQVAQAQFDGVVEAVRQTTLSAQVPGTVVQLAVKVGDTVKAGQLLVQLDARAANQGTAASQAQVGAARAGLEASARELERKRQLFAKNYISQAALDQAEAQFKVGQAQLDAQKAQVGLAQTQSGFYQLRAPFAGVVTAVPIEQGDMAMPGRPLVTLHDPSKLRVSVALPATVSRSALASPLTVELPGTATPSLQVAADLVEWLPTVDPQTLTRQMRIKLPPLTGVVPGMFARVSLAVNAPASAGSAAASAPRAALRIPVKALVRRTEMLGVYVMGANGKALLRQVRIGAVFGDEVEILSGIEAGEVLVLDAQAAARQP